MPENIFKIYPPKKAPSKDGRRGSGLWSEDDSENLDYENDTSEAENEEDLTDYETSEIDKYDAKENKELEDLQ